MGKASLGASSAIPLAYSELRLVTLGAGPWLAYGLNPSRPGCCATAVRQADAETQHSMTQPEGPLDAQRDWHDGWSGGSVVPSIRCVDGSGLVNAEMKDMTDAGPITGAIGRLTVKASLAAAFAAALMLALAATPAAAAPAAAASTGTSATPPRPATRPVLSLAGPAAGAVSDNRPLPLATRRKSSSPASRPD